MAIYLDGKYLLFFPAHSVKHDEWGTAELSWALAKTLGCCAVIPSKQLSERDEGFVFNKIGKFEFNILVELGGWKKEGIGVISNNLKILKNIIRFLKRWYPVTSARFHTAISRKYLYDYQKLYIRFEIPRDIRNSFDKSIRLFVILHSLFFKMRKLDFKPITKEIQSPSLRCAWCGLPYIEPNLLNLQLCIDCLISIDIWKVAVDIGRDKFTIDGIEKYCRPRKRHKPTCLFCKRTFYSDLEVPVCNDHTVYVDIQSYILELATNLTTLDKIKERMSKAGSKKMVTYPSSFVTTQMLGINLNNYTCLCGKPIKHNKVILLRLRLCKECSKQYDINRICEDIKNNNLSYSAFIGSSFSRQSYLIHPPITPANPPANWNIGSGDVVIEPSADYIYGETTSADSY